MNMDEYTKQVAEYMHKNPDLRVGQAFFNVLYSINPELASEISGTEFDPFYDNSKLNKFLTKVSVAYDEKTI